MTSRPCKIIVASDIHLMDHSLVIEEGPAFKRVVDADRKLLIESEAILDRFIEEIKVINPELLLITGDLTKDGELLNHNILADKLLELRKLGIKSYVIPGNHDINNPQSRCYKGSEHRPVETVSPEQFRELYELNGYGGEELIELGPDLCYVVEPIEGLRIIGIDSCFYDDNFEDNYPYTGGRINERRLVWIEEVAKQSREEGKQILAMMHHSLLEHFPLQSVIAREYLIEDWLKVAARLSNAGIEVMLTGHFHAQDVVALRFPNGALWDVQTGSIVTYPNPYRIIDLYKDRLEITSPRVQMQNELTGGQTLQDYSYDHLKSGIPGLAKYLAEYMNIKYPDSIKKEQTDMILDMVPHFTPLIMDIYSGILSGDEVGLKYNPDPEKAESEPMSGDLLQQLKQFVAMIAPKYTSLFSSIEGHFHSSVIEDNTLVIPLK